MKLTVIGCSGAYPKEAVAASCYLVSKNNTNILLDMGSGSLSIVQKYLALPKIDAVIITHFHADHFCDALCLQHAALIDMQLGNRDKPIVFYAPQDNFYFNKLNFENCTKAVAIDECSQLQIGDLRFNFSKTVHPVYGLAVKITDGQKTMIYTSDTENNPDLERFASNCDLLLGECSIYREYEGIIKGHMSAKDLAGLAVNSRAKRLVATHLPVYGDNDELIEDIRQIYKLPVDKAREGLRIEI